MYIKTLNKTTVPPYLLSLTFAIFGFCGLWAQQSVNVNGTVISASDEMPIPGVSILVAGTSTGTTTDFDGNYELKTTSDAVLTFSYVGFAMQEIVVDGRTQINVKMVTNTSELDEVVVVGYGTTKKQDITGAISSISAEDVKRSINTTVEQALQGRAAGVEVTQNSGAPGGWGFS
jgi:hypothetical protein